MKNIIARKRAGNITLSEARKMLAIDWRIACKNIMVIHIITLEKHSDIETIK